MNWLRNAKDREGGRKQRNKEKKEKDAGKEGPSPTELDEDLLEIQKKLNIIWFNPSHTEAQLYMLSSSGGSV